MKRNLAFALTLAAGLVLTALGIAQGQPGLVMAKAIRVCMECVGIG